MTLPKVESVRTEIRGGLLGGGRGEIWGVYNQRVNTQKYGRRNESVEPQKNASANRTLSPSAYLEILDLYVERWSSSSRV